MLFESLYISFPGSSAGKEFASNGGDPGSIPGLGRSPGEETDDPLQCSVPGKFHGQRGAQRATIPGVAKESDTT